MGILELTSFGNYTFIRCFRVLRPLRAITKIESLKVGGCTQGCWGGCSDSVLSVR